MKPADFKTKYLSFVRLEMRRLKRAKLVQFLLHHGACTYGCGFALHHGNLAEVFGACLRGRKLNWAEWILAHTDNGVPGSTTSALYAYIERLRGGLLHSTNLAYSTVGEQKFNSAMVSMSKYDMTYLPKKSKAKKKKGHK